MNGKTLEDLELEVEAQKAFEELHGALDEIDERPPKDIRMLVEARGKAYERFINALKKAGLESVAIEVLPDDEAQDDEGEHAENL